jgi:hypothetical protein
MIFGEKQQQNTPPKKKYKPKQIQKKAKKKIKTKKEVTQIKLTLFFVKRLEIQNN